MAEPVRPQMAIWRMRTVCWITKATDTHSECVIRIVFPPQQCLHEHSSVLRYTDFACLPDMNYAVRPKRTAGIE